LALHTGAVSWSQGKRVAPYGFQHAHGRRNHGAAGEDQQRSRQSHQAPKSLVIATGDSRKALTMSQFTRKPFATKLTIGALLVSAVGILLQYLSGVGDFPTIPPGPIILTILAGIIAFAPWRWIPILSSVMGIALIVGFFLNESVDRLTDVTPILGLVGLWIQAAGMVVAIAAGVMATLGNDQGETDFRYRRQGTME